MFEHNMSSWNVPLLNGTSLSNSTNYTQACSTNITCAPPENASGKMWTAMEIECLDSLDFYKSVKKVRFYGCFILAVFGCLSNGLAFTVLVRSKMKSTPTGLCFLLLAIADTIVLLIGSLHPNVIGQNVNPVSCKMAAFLLPTAQTWSGLIVAAITIERFVLVVFPLKAKLFLTPMKTRLTLIFLPFLAAASAFYEVISHSSVADKEGCILLPSMEDMHFAGTLIQYGFSEVVLSAVVAIFTLVIIIALVRTRKLAGRTYNHQEQQLTLTLIAVALTFVLLRLPRTVAYYLYLRPHWVLSHCPDNYNDPIERYQAISLLHRLKGAKLITELFWLSNHVINFYLYCMCGARFRLHLKALVTCKPATHRYSMANATILTRTSTYNANPRQNGVLI